MFQHKGIVLNFEDFKGPIEFYICFIRKNFIFIPYILNTPISKSLWYGSLNDYYSETYKEYAFGIYDESTATSSFLLSDAYDVTFDIESLYNKFERLSPIYISRNRDKMIFAGNRFENNIGTFGGAVLVNSPDF